MFFNRVHRTTSNHVIYIIELGVFIICSALIADAIIGNYQEKIMKVHHVSNVEIVFYSFMFGFMFVLVGLLLTDNFFSGLYFWNKVCRKCLSFIIERNWFCVRFSASIANLRLWFSILDFRLFRHWYCPNIDKRIRRINLCNSDNLS
jgi:hypothetical protein